MPCPPAAQSPIRDPIPSVISTTGLRPEPTFPGTFFFQHRLTRPNMNGTRQSRADSMMKLVTFQRFLRVLPRDPRYDPVAVLASSGSTNLGRKPSEVAGVVPSCLRWAAPATFSPPVYKCSTTRSFSPGARRSKRQPIEIIFRPGASCSIRGKARIRPARQQEQEALRLTRLTGWDIHRIHGRMNLRAGATGGDEKTLVPLSPAA